MKYLLDTHVILWWLTDPKKLSSEAKRIIEDREDLISVSSVSFWEMAIKQSLGKLSLPPNILAILTKEGFEILPIDAQECLSITALPLLHGDPFDRLLVVQAKLRDLILITRDEKISQYPVMTLQA